MLFSHLTVLVILTINCFISAEQLRKYKVLPIHRHALKLRDKIMRRQPARICYDLIGCFNLTHRHAPLQKMPEDPKLIDTKFYLFRRNVNFSQPVVIYYDDNAQSLKQSPFNATQPIKIIIHGYLSQWNRKGALEGADAFLKIADSNVILVDWERGAKGPQYAVAAANTEVVGRQLGILLLEMINLGLNPKSIHLIGFSLGAHVAGCASELLKFKGFLIGRITGLDAASPLFKHNHFREKSRKLDESDAEFVDVIHTDGSSIFTDGFGLLEPIGHVDYFPNGGLEQPGCVDGRGSVVVSHFDRNVNPIRACSHVRAWELFLETLKYKAFPNSKSCELKAYHCFGGLTAFQAGLCFPRIEKSDNPLFRTDLGKLGIEATGRGIMYLVTTDTAPYCAHQLLASVLLSSKNEEVLGTLQLGLQYSNYSTNFDIKFEMPNYIPTNREMKGLGAAQYNSFNFNLKVMSATLNYLPVEVDNRNVTYNPPIYIERIVVTDMYGNSWKHCQSTVLKSSYSNNYDLVLIMLSKENC